jgi:dipeptidase D
MRYTNNYKLEKIGEDEELYSLKITGLFGGHSGVDIDKGRINSNLLAATFLDKLTDIQIASFVGGNKDNAIANATEVTFTTKDKEASQKLQEFFESIEVTEADNNLKMELEIQEKIDESIKVMSKEDSDNLIRLFLNLKQNVIAMSKDVEGLVETSGNIGIAKIQDGKALICEALRSSIDSDKVEVMNYNNSIAEKLGFEILGEGDYPGWKYNPNSKLEKIYVNSYKKSHNGQEPIVCAIHAGVECGMIYEKMPHLEMISLGPDVVDVHTVNEKLYIKSCKTLLETLMYMIEELD